MSTESQTANDAPTSWAVWSFAATILLSAFLLFQVQPLVSKCILPWFGGCPAVWTTCMLFFQTLLFGGYVYAHLLQRWLAPRGQVLVHLALALLAGAMLLARLGVAPGARWQPTGSDAPTWRILVLLTATVGLPYFVLSGTSPLVQAWFSRSHPGRSPYRLYALSNVGSLAALLSYPFFFEWALDLKNQSLVWSAAFIVYAALCGVCLLFLWRLRQAEAQGLQPVGLESRENVASEVLSGAADDPPPSPTWLRRALWLALPACGSLMLLATTNHVCQDVAVVPFLWVAPLTLYLLSFIICFDHERWYVRGLWSALAILAIVAVAIQEIFRLQDELREAAVGQWLIWLVGEKAYQKVLYEPGFTVQLVLCFAALFFACMVCHGELVRLRPHPRRLTEFYLLIAAGGALGGACVSMLAPAIFNSFLEWPIGLVVCYAIAAAAFGLGARPGKLRLARGVAATLFSGGLLSLLLFQWFCIAPLERKRWHLEDRKRNFYGVVTVEKSVGSDPGYEEVILRHGQITHGLQFTDPEKRRWATSYYGEGSGVGQALGYLRQRGNVRVGVVGLGTGSLAVYAEPGDDFQFYEINPQVERMAGKYFTYLSDCRARLKDDDRCRVVMGDARLSLERQEPQHLDLLVLDAFSGDAIPTHLLTHEAFKIFYRRHLASRGVIAVHISNRYLDLAPVVRGLAERFCLKAIRVCTDEEDPELMIYRADWMLLSDRDNEEFFQAVPPQDDHAEVSVPLWTDQYNNLFQILLPQ